MDDYVRTAMTMPSPVSRPFADITATTSVRRLPPFARNRSRTPTWRALVERRAPIGTVSVRPLSTARDGADTMVTPAGRVMRTITLRATTVQPFDTMIVYGVTCPGTTV